MVTSLNKLKFQQTINEKFSISGIGLHTGVSSTITIKPAPPNHGIKFKRIDIKSSIPIEASVSNVIDVTRGTTIGTGGVEVHTVEHLLAAIHGLNIDLENYLLKDHANRFLQIKYLVYHRYCNH